MIDLGNGIRLLKTTIKGSGPTYLLAADVLDKQGQVTLCAILIEGAGWVPCAREASDVMREVRKGGVGI